MYCSTCGTLVDSQLVYCQRCGARVVKNAAALERQDASGLKDLVFFSGGIGIAGLGITLGLIAVLLNYNVDLPVVLALTALFLTVASGITFWMIRQTSRMFKAAEAMETDFPERAELDRRSAAQIEEAREDFLPSVTENTTRTLDEATVKRN